MSEIKSIHIDKNNIFVTDENKILYEFENGYFYPYIYNFGDIVTCIKNKKCTFVYTSSSQLYFVFPKNGTKYDYEYLCLDAYIDSMACYKNKNILLTIENGIIYEYQFLYGHNLNVLKTESSWVYNPKIPPPKIIKIIDDYILVYYDHYCNIQFESQVIASFNILEENFNLIKDIDDEKIFLSTGINVLFNDELFMSKKLAKGNINQTCNNLKICNDGYHFFVLVNKILDYFNEIIDSINFECTDDIDNTDFDCIDYTINIDIIKYTNIVFTRDVTIKYNGYLLIVGYANKYIIVHSKNVYDLNFNDMNINFDILLNESNKKTNSLFIDINITQSIIPQLVTLIPAIYRLNNDKFFDFENIVDNVTISYGIGVTRSVFNKLSKELDEIFSLLNSDIPYTGEYNFIQIGKLLYFCVFDGKTKICNLPGYFFYKLLSSYKNITDSDIFRLFERFKDTPNILYQQYLTYLKDSTSLLDLHMEITNIDEYLTFLFTEKIGPENIKAYNDIIVGYNYFFTRNKNFSIIRLFPAIFNLSKFVDDSCVINFEFKHNLSTHKGNNLIDKYAKAFVAEFQNQDLVNKLQFVQNITGNRYYRSKICIIFDEYVNRDYEISTCNAEVTIFSKNGKVNVTEIIRLIAVEDNHIVDT